MSRTTRAVTAADRIIADRMRAARKRAGLSQERVAERVGITWQQYQKYEAAHNRIAAGRLVFVAAALGVSAAQLLPTPDEVAT